MKKTILTGEYGKRRDELIEQCMREIDEKTPKPIGTFDQRPDAVMREIAEKYISLLAELLQEGKEAGEYEIVEDRPDGVCRQRE